MSHFHLQRIMCEIELIFPWKLFIPSLALPPGCNWHAPVSLDWKAVSSLPRYLSSLSTSLNALMIPLSKCPQAFAAASYELTPFLQARRNNERAGRVMSIQPTCPASSS